MRHADEYRNRELCLGLADRIKRVCQKDMRVMEVCGTHTVALFRQGIRSLLPQSLSLISGPGCPVCVTDQTDIDAFIALAREENTIIATFGDLLRVPGSDSSLRKEQAAGRDIRIVYSTMDALDLAQANPDKQVIFPGVGFETTIPTIAASILTAKQKGLENFSVYCSHKLVPPALEALVDTRDIGIDGFLLPGHVSVITGKKGYDVFFRRYGIPAVIAGFEPVDMLAAILRLVEMIASGVPDLVNAYSRAVSERGNEQARRIMKLVFKTCDTTWRGMGVIPASGMTFRDEFAGFDAAMKFRIKIPEAPLPRGCACGDILTGKLTPQQCTLYAKTCTPLDPVGPCMVSSEGACAAYYKYTG